MRLRGGRIANLALMCLFLACLSLAWATPSSLRAQSRSFDGWMAAVIAADWRATDGTPIRAFDNARRDLAAGFIAAGFDPALMVDYSLNPDAPDAVDGATALRGVTEAASRGQSGCLVYLTSHGSPEGVIFGANGWITPEQLNRLLVGWCDARPTVVVVSACYSGVFVPHLAAANRLILTAARADRSSFGCDEDATYPYFDGCVLEALPQARHFLDLAAAARACVARRETTERLTPASEPQMFVGGEMQILAPTLRFND